MTPRDFPDFARLWKEQVDPAEQASLRALANTIRHTARRRKGFDFTVGLAAIALALFFLAQATLPVAGLVYIVVIVAIAGLLWARHQVAESARAMVADEPSQFFAAAIKSVQGELRLSTFGLCLAAPGTVSLLIMGLVDRGANTVDLLLGALSNFALPGLFLIIAFAYFVWENIQLRQQLRRLEEMSHEYEEETLRDMREEA